jgi:hypothetical protein
MEVMYLYVYFIGNMAVSMWNGCEMDSSSVLLIAWTRILEKLIVFQSIIKFPFLYRRFIIALTSSHLPRRMFNLVALTVSVKNTNNEYPHYVRALSQIDILPQQFFLELH